jgi:D-3-phosphoglycerate dehydrogenase
MIKILANDGIDPIGKKMLEDAGFFVETNNIPQDELPVRLQEYDAITVRSATKVRSALIDACPNLKLIGRGGVGVDNIDVDYAKGKGIGVYNTPASSSLSVAELVFAQLFTGVRSLHDSNRKMPVEGGTKFNDLKKAYAKGVELRGKTLGIVGFGRIGREVAKIAIPV